MHQVDDPDVLDGREWVSPEAEHPEHIVNTLDLLSVQTAVHSLQHSFVSIRIKMHRQILVGSTHLDDNAARLAQDRLFGPIKEIENVKVLDGLRCSARSRHPRHTHTIL
jgi:hypothetical protein